MSSPNYWLTEIECEFDDSCDNHSPSFTNAHEAYAVLLEEVEELWAEIKVNKASRDPAKMQKEAVQVAAMALKFLTSDLT